jgi:hypothetical protein
MKRFLLPCIILFFVPTINGQLIYVEGQSEDNIGNRLIYKLKENIRQSKNMELVLSEDISKIQINIVTLDALEDNLSTVYSIVWTWTTPSGCKSFFTHHVGMCGKNKINDVAENMVADTDKIIMTIQKMILDIYNENQ